MTSYMTMIELKSILQSMNAKNPEQPLKMFSRVCKVIKCFAKQKGIYYYKLGYLNGVSIMIMVAYVLG